MIILDSPPIFIAIILEETVIKIYEYSEFFSLRKNLSNQLLLLSTKDVRFQASHTLRSHY